jgi:drug/metabolite transporter (DMT)-like permease
VDAVVLAAVGGVLFGVMTVAVQWALARGADPIVGAAAVTGIGAICATLFALPSIVRDAPVGDVWRFAVVGALVPGMSQVLFIHSIRAAGPSRAAIVIGTAPLLSIVLALLFLDEPFQIALLVATGFVIAGGIMLATERARPAEFRAVGVVLALACATLFAVRDNAVRWLARGTDVPPLQAAAASLVAAALVMVVFVVAVKRVTLTRLLPAAIRSFAPAGVTLALAYACLVTAFDRGRVGIVAPLNATQSLWAVVIAGVVLRRSEMIGRRTVGAAVLVLIGGVIVGIIR